MVEAKRCKLVLTDNEGKISTDVVVLGKYMVSDLEDLIEVLNNESMIQDRIGGGFIVKLVCE